MKTYIVKFNGKQRGTISFDENGISEINFIDPSDQYHFMSEAKLWNPKDIGAFTATGYSMYDFIEVGDEV